MNEPNSRNFYVISEIYINFYAIRIGPKQPKISNRTGGIGDTHQIRGISMQLSLYLSISARSESEDAQNLESNR